jgi:hypothetical protein
MQAVLHNGLVDLNSGSSPSLVILCQPDGEEVILNF